MAFDWFRRTFFNRSGQDAEATTEPQEETLAEAEAAEVETAEVEAADITESPESSEAPEAELPVAEDVMAFAQATYESIQRQTVQPDVPAIADREVVTPETFSEIAETDAIAERSEPEPEAQLELDDEALEALTRPDLPTAVTPETLPEPVSSEAVEPASAAMLSERSLPIAAASPALEPTVETEAPWSSAEVEAQPLPFDASEARQVGSEEIQVADEPASPERIAPDADPGTSEPDEPVIPVFDEGFIWSAEVLARQGRKAEEISVEEINWLQKLRKGLAKTRLNVVNRLKAIVGQGPLNQDGVMEIETLLLQADVGVEATDYIIEQLQQKLRTEILPPDEAIAYLKKLLCDMLDRVQTEQFMPQKGALNIWLMTGVNGAGKTTTIGKIAHVAQKSGYHCMIAAADTFRAAAVEQVKVWGQRSNVEVICNPGKNTDPAAVVFDGISAAQSRGIDLLLVDTAGRLQNKKNLMEELSKIRRIVDKKAPHAHVESLLVLDATLGQNGLRQAQVFSESAQLTGVVLTKLDGTAKGGVALGVVQQLGLPIRFVGAGEGIEDLRPFSSYEFVEALLSS
jgi:fused signal recognition particle receptor